jgi:hypothetical protein
MHDGVPPKNLSDVSRTQSDDGVRLPGATERVSLRRLGWAWRGQFLVFQGRC